MQIELVVALSKGDRLQIEAIDHLTGELGSGVELVLTHVADIADVLDRLVQIGTLAPDRPALGAVVVASDPPAIDVQRWLDQGLRAIVEAQSAVLEIPVALERLREGRWCLSRSAALSLCTDSIDVATCEAALRSLSARERDVFWEMATSRTYQEMSSKLSISPKTVDTYRARLMKKLGISSRAAIMRMALGLKQGH